jgi:hypothetical protein
MRLILAAGATLAVLTSGLAALPASADTLAPVSKVTVTPSTGNDGTAFVNVSWASEPSDADGALVCLHRGTTAVQTPDNCESRIAVASPALESGPITIHTGKNYVVEVFSYQASSPIVYSSPVSRFRHGIKVALRSRCNGNAVGSTCHIVGTVTDAATGAKLAHRKLELWMSKERQPAKWSPVTTKTTPSTGQVQVTLTLSKSHLYQWHYASPRSHELPSNSSRVDIAVS